MAKKKSGPAGKTAKTAKPRAYVLVTKTEDAPYHFYPAGTLDELQGFYEKKTAPFKAAPPALARIETTMQLYALKREPEYKPLDATLSQRFANAAARVQKTAAAVLRDLPGKTIRTETLGEDLAAMGKHLLQAAQRKLSNGAETGRIALHSLRSEFQPELADGVTTAQGQRYVNSSWLIRNGNAAPVPVSILRDAPPAPGKAPRP